MSEGVADPIRSAGKGRLLAKPLRPGALGELIEPLIPPHPPQPKGGRPSRDDRQVLSGIIFLLKTGIPGEDWPQEMGGGGGLTCWNRWRDRQAAGAWGRIQEVLSAHLRGADQIACSRFVVDTGQVRAVGGGEETGPRPVDRSRPGSQHAIVTAAQGAPWVIDPVPADTPDANRTVPLIDAVPPSPARRVAPGAARTAPGATAVATTKADGRSGAAGGSIRSRPDGGRPTVGARGGLAGWSSGRPVGSISSAGCAGGSSGATPSIRGCVIWPRSSSPPDFWSCTASCRPPGSAGLF